MSRAEHVPLSAMNPTTRFTDRVDDYVRFRPSYPAAVIDAVLDGLIPTNGRTLRAVDLGAGTGICSRLLAARGVRVIAVEPNDAMRAAGEAVADANIQWRGASAESSGVPDGWADLVIAAQAWHWFDPAPTGVEVLRILRPGGLLAVVWNTDDDTDGGTNAFRAAVQSHATTQRVHQEMVDAGAIPRLGGPWRSTSVREERFPHVQRLTLEGLLGRARSASYAPKETASLASMERALRAVFDAHAKARDHGNETPRRGAGSSGGDVAGDAPSPDRLIELRYVTRAFIAQRPV